MCFYEYKKVSSFGISLIPGLGDAKDLQEAIGGMDLITGKKLSALERALAGACVIVPVVSGSMVRIAGKNANIAEKMSLSSEKQLFRKGAKAGITMCEDAKKEMEQLIREIRNILEEDVDIKRLFAKNKNTGLQVEIAGVGKVSLEEAEKLVGKDVRWSRGESGSTTVKNGATRAAQYSSEWGDASLQEAIDKFAPNVEPVVTSKGKFIYNNQETGISVVYDKNGNYFRIEDTTRPRGRNYLDIDGNDMNNEVVNGKTRGRSRADYQRVTHFNNSDK